jgi:iron-sulfur cluster assembly protein
MTITDTALQKLKSLQEGDKALRVSVIGGGCSGLSYKMSWADAPNEGDRVTNIDGLMIVVDPKSFLFIQGIELDFSDGLDGQGFQFSNPNAKKSCGCGSSFSV